MAVQDVWKREREEQKTGKNILENVELGFSSTC